jgi:hypothetical protein
MKGRLRAGGGLCSAGGSASTSRRYGLSAAGQVGRRGVAAGRQRLQAELRLGSGPGPGARGRLAAERAKPGHWPWRQRLTE